MTKSKQIIASTIVAGAMVMQGTAGDAQGTSTGPASDESIRPFHVNVPQQQLDDL